MALKPDRVSGGSREATAGMSAGARMINVCGKADGRRGRSKVRSKKEEVRRTNTASRDLWETLGVHIDMRRKRCTRSVEVFMPDKRMYVEKRTAEGDYAVRRAGSQRASAVKSTQKKAIKKSRKIEPKSKPRVERVRKTATGGPDKWRSP
jgi:Uncharacterized protein conserved in bacteria (DUF2188)